MKKIIFLILTISFSFGGFISGNKLYENAIKYERDISSIDSGVYIGYVFGVFDSYDKILFCSPYNVTGRQVFDIVFQYLKNHPEERNEAGNILILKALKEIWPCKK